MQRLYAALPADGSPEASGAAEGPKQLAAGRGDGPPRRCWRVAAAAGPLLLLLSVAGGVLTVGRGSFGGAGPAREEEASSVGDAVREFDMGLLKDFGMDLYKTFGGFDPFDFKCPLPGLSMVDQVEGVIAPGASEVETCCSFYDQLKWPYQFPRCQQTSSNCSTCAKTSGRAALDAHPVAGLAAAAWAANTAVYSFAETSVGTELKGFVQSKLLRKDVTHAELPGGVMQGKVREGLVARETDLCPHIHDWKAYMLNEHDENIHARVYKSVSAKLAIVAFRGTEQTSASNWEVDADLRTAPLRLDEENSTLVHRGFLRAVERILPRIRKWVDGYVFHLFGAVPEDWTLVFTGHSLGGALAVLATTLAELQGWHRRPDATIVFGSPRVADEGLDRWWRERGLCRRLLRVNVYNDVIHWMPFLTTWRWFDMLRDFLGCMRDLKACLDRGPFAPAVELSDRWTHVCSESEFLVPGSTRGVNVHLDDLSPVGGVLSHLIMQCLYGYAHGVAHSGILERDAYCGIGPSICPSWAGQEAA